MNERVGVPTTGFRLSSLATPRTIEVVKPAPGQSITIDLDDKSATTLDFSAIAHESLNIVHAGPRLIVEFDNQSAIIAEPFFDLSGKPLPYLEVELGGIRPMSGEQFAALLSGTVGQPAAGDEDKIPSSGASFVAPALDVLPESLRPLTLLGQEAHGALSAGSSSGADDKGITTPHALQLNIAPVVNIPGPGGAATLVFEGGLLASRGPGESAGSHAGSAAFPVTTKLGVISFTSPDGVQSVSLGGHVLTTAPQTFTDATGSLTASYTFDATTHKGAISYTYTLLDNTAGVSIATFPVVVTDSDGHSNAPGNLVITIADDSPIARADADNVAGGQVTAETGNVLTGAGTALGSASADVPGADGGISVVGVAAGNGTGGVNSGSVGVAIVGAFGTLTVNADGSYSYLHATGGGGLWRNADEYDVC